jgi:hypothetical protein
MEYVDVGSASQRGDPHDSHVALASLRGAIRDALSRGGSPQ